MSYELLSRQHSHNWLCIQNIYDIWTLICGFKLSSLTLFLKSKKWWAENSHLWCMWFSGLLKWAQNVMTSVFISDKRGGDTHTQKRGHVQTDREWNYVAISQGIPRAIWSWRRQGGFSPRTFRGNMTLKTLWLWTSSFQNYERINLYWPQMTKFVVIHYDSHRKLIYMAVPCCKKVVECVSGVVMYLSKTTPNSGFLLL